MNRRHLLTTAAAMALAASARMAHPQDRSEPWMSAPKIIESLTPKDIAIDEPDGRRHAPARRTSPRAVHLHVAFDFDSARLLPTGRAQLDELALVLGHHALQRTGFLLAGHTDRIGDADYNVMLSLARAEAAKSYLVLQHGLSTQRLQTWGYGCSQLLDPRHPASAMNRRVEVRAMCANVQDRVSFPGRVVAAPGGSLS